MGGFNPPPPPLIYLDTWISNIDFLSTGNQRINANMVNCNMDEHVIAFFIFSSPEPKAHGELRPKEKICVFPVTSPKKLG